MDIVILVLKIILILIMCHILSRMVMYTIIQVKGYYYSRNIKKFLDKKQKSAEAFIEEKHYLWRRNFEKAPYLKGGGMRAFVWALICQAREDIAIRNFENTEGLGLYCFSCYFNPKCAIKYYLTCRCCLNNDCELKKRGRDKICKRFRCITRIEND